MNLEQQRDALMERINEYKTSKLNPGLLKSELMATLFAVASEAMAQQKERDAKIADEIEGGFARPALGDVAFGASVVAAAIRNQGEA